MDVMPIWLLKQKNVLAKQLNLRLQQMEVWL
jgi:hypothetical protein